MPLIKRIRSRGANMVVVANAEVLFTPGGEIARFNNSLSQRVRRATAANAPGNKRPRWSHYGKPLKQTMRSASDINPVTMQAYWAVGSTAPYSAYVDQGTGVYAGHGPYQAKILPPWTRGSASLYEHTWKVPKHSGTDNEGKSIIEFEEVGTVTIKGQKGQFYFDRGLETGLLSMQVANRSDFGSPIVAAAVAKIPDRLHGFLGNTPWSFAFDAQLREWRSWRDAAWRAGKVLGVGYNRERERREYRRTIREGRDEAERQAARERARGYARARQERYRRRQGAVSRSEYDRERRRNRVDRAARSQDGAKFLAAMRKKYGSGNVDGDSLTFRGGRWYVLVKKGGRGSNFTEVSAPAKFRGAATAPSDEQLGL